MNYNDNLPAGALHDKRAPYNQQEPRTTICSYCIEPIIWDDLNEEWIHERTMMKCCPEDEEIEK